MSYDGKINRKLSLIKIKKEKSKFFPDTIEYKLAYGKTKHKYFKNKKILKYINVNYLKNDKIIEENLLNDLITFKTYRDDVEITEKNWEILQNFITIYIALFGNILISKMSMIEKFGFTIGVFVVSVVIFIIRTWKHSNYYKLKYINNAIYTLETIKEDKYRNGIWCKKSDERYEGLELTEVKEIRTYKATRNKYRPRAMHHRKRR